VCVCVCVCPSLLAVPPRCASSLCLLKMIGLFCKTAQLKRLYSAKETSNCLLALLRTSVFEGAGVHTSCVLCTCACSYVCVCVCACVFEGAGVHT